MISVHDVDEMDSNWDSITDYVSISHPIYIDLFKSQEMAIERRPVKAALIEFMRGLTTPDFPLIDIYVAMYRCTFSRWNAVKTFQEEGMYSLPYQGTNIGGGTADAFWLLRIIKNKIPSESEYRRFMFTQQPQDSIYFVSRA